MAHSHDDILRLARNRASLRLKASQHKEAELKQLAMNMADKAVLHIVMDREIRIEDAVSIAASGKGTVMFDYA